MDLYRNIQCLIIVCLIGFSFEDIIKKKTHTASYSHEMCVKLAKEPYFDIDAVIGEPWRIYYTWNLKLESSCLDMKFRNATPQIVSRIWADMSEYLDQQPAWEAATLQLVMGSANHEVLLFADQGPAGGFIGVPNIIRTGNFLPVKNAVPLLKFHLKLLRGAKFLLMVDCYIGGASLAARFDSLPYRSEIEATVATLDFGNGFPACSKDRNKGEEFFVK